MNIKTKTKLTIAALAAAAVLTGCDDDVKSEQKRECIISRATCSCCNSKIADKIIAAIDKLTEAVKANQQKGETHWGTAPHTHNLKEKENE